VEGVSGADKKAGVRALDPGLMLLQLAEHNMRRQIERKRQSFIAKGQVPPNVMKTLSKKKEEFKPLSSDFIDSLRTRIKFSMKNDNGKGVTRHAVLDAPEPSCECGGPEVDEIPCGCLVSAAEKKGVDIGPFLGDHDTAETWKAQYHGLPAFKIPGNEVVKLLGESELKQLPPVTYPQKPGRPSTARIKSALEQYRKYKKARVDPPP
jgi:hypothetical protein